MGYKYFVKEKLMGALKAETKTNDSHILVEKLIEWSTNADVDTIEIEKGDF